MTLRERLADWIRKRFGSVKINGKCSSIKEAEKLINECIKNGENAHCIIEIKGERYECDIN